MPLSCPPCTHPCSILDINFTAFPWIFLFLCFHYTSQEAHHHIWCPHGVFVWSSRVHVLVTFMLTPLAFSSFQVTCTAPPDLGSEREEYGVDCVPDNTTKLRRGLGGEICVCVVGLYASLLHGGFAARASGSSPSLCFFPGVGFLHAAFLCWLFSSGWGGREGN